MLPWKLRKRQILPVNQNRPLVYFSPAKFQLVSWFLSLAMIGQMTYTHKLPKLCSATLKALLQTKYDIQDRSCIHTPYIKLIIQNITQQLLKVIWEDATTFVKPVFVYNHTVPTNQKPPSNSYFTKLSYGFRKQ